MRFCLTSLAIFAVFLGISMAASHRAINNICVTQECNATALRIKDNMDLGVNPCDDFYEFTCGGYIKNTTIPEEDQYVDVYGSHQEQFELQLKSLYEADIEKDDMKLVKLAKTLYKSCMDEVGIEAAGVGPVKELLKHIGGWPVLEGDSWNEENFEWIASTAEWYRAGLTPDIFIRFTIEADPNHILRRIIYVGPPSWISKLAYLKKGLNAAEQTTAYYKAMVDIAVSLGAERKRAEDELEEALLFQIKLSKLKDRAKRNFNRLTLKELVERYPRVDWRDTFERMYSPTQIIGDDDLVVVRMPGFIRQAIDLVLKTPNRVLANFAILRMILVATEHVIPEIDAILKFHSVSDLGNPTNFLPRWVNCHRMVVKCIPLSSIVMYSKKFLKPEIKRKADDIMRKIRREYQRNINMVPFVLDDVTRAIARKKEKAINIVVGYPDGLLDNDNLDDYYKDLNFFQGKYFFNVLRASQFQYKEIVRDFRKPRIEMNSTTILRMLMDIEVYTVGDANSILVPIGNLQGAPFHPERPDYINFATIGASIAHELTHFFETKGILYDEYGNRTEWRTPPTKEAFEEGAKCFVDQYGSYTEETLKLKVDGVKTLNENIADNAGAKVAYYAYVNSMRGKAPEKTLPGLDYSPNQMYWIALSNTLCEKSRPAYLKRMWPILTHAINRFRVTGMVSNREEFANDFKCPLGSKMNPVKKCSLW